LCSRTRREAVFLWSQVQSSRTMEHRPGGKRIARKPFPRLFHPIATWRLRLDELDVDDAKLEDEQEPLYAHGCKMDSGLGQGQNQLSPFKPKLRNYDR
jgi:hypothetical protein